VGVCESNAGFYIGTYSTDPWYEPTCRISGYFSRKEEAFAALKTMAFPRRKCVENEYCQCNV